MASYRKQQIGSKMSRMKPRKFLLAKPWFWIVFFIIILFGFLVYFLVFSEFLKIKNVYISGNTSISTEEILSVVMPEIEVNFASVGNIKLSSQSILLLSPKNISEKIRNSIFQIEQANIKRSFPQTLIVNIIERQPIGAYCVDSENGECFLFDSQGTAFKKIDSVPSDIPMVYFGQNVLDANIAKDLEKIFTGLDKDIGINISEVLVSGPNRVNVLIKGGWEVYFYIGGNPDIASQLNKLYILLENGLTAEQKENLRYIDLRPSGRAIVCDNKVCSY